MQLTTSSFTPGGMIPLRHAFSRIGGNNVAPALHWSDAPADTASFAVICFDPDAPRGGFYHWGVYDLPADCDGLPENGPLPAGARQAVTGYGSAGYGGPCPPPGKPHRYVFTVYALPTPNLNLPANADCPALQAAVDTQALASASVTGLFQTRQ